MVLQNMTWRDVAEIDRSVVVLIPAGSLEQHGPALPLFTDTLLVTSVAEEIERRIPSQVLLTPTLWLGGSEHHLKFPGSLTNDLVALAKSLESIVESLIPHGFGRFYVVNGHGGNTTSISLALRNLKMRYRNLVLGSAGYYYFCNEVVSDLMEGPQKTLQHSDEAETSLVMHVAPELVRTDKLRDDGLKSDPPVVGLVSHFDELTEEGVMGYATYATAEKGKAIFEASVSGVVKELTAIYEGVVFKS